MREREPRSSRAVLSSAHLFTNKAFEAANKFYGDFNIDDSLQLSPEQAKVFFAFFAHYWVLKKNLGTARLARNPMLEQMVRMPVLRIIPYKIWDIDAGVNMAGATLLELAQKYAERITDHSTPDIRNAANILSSIYLAEDLDIQQVNQKIDRALSRIKIGKVRV